MDQQDVDALLKQREITVRAFAAMAAINASLDDMVRWRNEKQPVGRCDSPHEVLRGVLLDLLDGCWDSGFQSGENSPGR